MASVQIQDCTEVTELCSRGLLTCDAVVIRTRFSVSDWSTQFITQHSPGDTQGRTDGSYLGVSVMTPCGPVGYWYVGGTHCRLSSFTLGKRWQFIPPKRRCARTRLYGDITILTAVMTWKSTQLKGLWGVCVCVCVCVWERERERICGRSWKRLETGENYTYEQLG